MICANDKRNQIQKLQAVLGLPGGRLWKTHLEGIVMRDMTFQPECGSVSRVINTKTGYALSDAHPLIKLSFSKNFLYEMVMQKHSTHKNAAGLTLTE